MKAVGYLVTSLSCWSFLSAVVAAKKVANGSFLDDVTDVKEFKKLLRTKSNLLVAFHDGGLSRKTGDLLVSVAKASKGKGTVVEVDCGHATGKKLCKRLKVDDELPGPVLKHFSGGEFHKDYDRPMTESSLISFILDPSGDALWEDDPEASDVLFLPNPTSLNKALKKDKAGILIVFYAPWCGHCKRMKPEYQSAASAVKGKATMAAMNVDKATNRAVKDRFNITGFPTLLYFENGHRKFDFVGRSKADFVDFLSGNFPRHIPTVPDEADKEVAWSDEPSDVVHLTDANFDEVIGGQEAALVMFYAPWCGHCKRMKPEYVAAAREMKEKGVSGVLAAVDATLQRNLAKRFDVGGFPTLKYFKDGVELFDAGNVRSRETLASFMADPRPPPPPEKPWSEEDGGEVEHLDEDTFRPRLKTKKHVLVTFYAPWCGHCKAARPEITAAAEQMNEDARVKFVAVDCTANRRLCEAHGVTGYPTFKYFSYFDRQVVEYGGGGRKKDDFVRFMTGKMSSGRTEL